MVLTCTLSPCAFLTCCFVFQQASHGSQACPIEFVSLFPCQEHSNRSHKAPALPISRILVLPSSLPPYGNGEHPWRQVKAWLFPFTGPLCSPWQESPENDMLANSGWTTWACSIRSQARFQNQNREGSPCLFSEAVCLSMGFVWSAQGTNPAAFPLPSVLRAQPRARAGKVVVSKAHEKSSWLDLFQQEHYSSSLSFTDNVYIALGCHRCVFSFCRKEYIEHRSLGFWRDFRASQPDEGRIDGEVGQDSCFWCC